MLTQFRYYHFKSIYSLVSIIEIEFHEVLCKLHYLQI